MTPHDLERAVLERLRDAALKLANSPNYAPNTHETFCANLAIYGEALDALPPHQHTVECWEPDSGCDMGRNPEYMKAATPEETAQINAAVNDGWIEHDGGTRPATLESKLDAQIEVELRNGTVGLLSDVEMYRWFHGNKSQYDILHYRVVPTPVVVGEVCPSGSQEPVAPTAPEPVRREWEISSMAVTTGPFFAGTARVREVLPGDYTQAQAKAAIQALERIVAGSAVEARHTAEKALKEIEEMGK